MKSKSQGDEPQSVGQTLLTGKWKKIPRCYKGGNDETRRRFVSWKKTLMRGSLRPRMDILASAQKNALWEIPRDIGFKVMPPGAFSETEQLMELARKRVAEVSPEEVKTSKSQLLQGLIDKKQLTLESLQLQFGLREDILNAVTTYLGIAPILEDVDVWRSFFHGQEKWGNSQLWHCDSIDTEQIKIFLYSNDVGPDSGPLTLLSAAASQRVRDAIDYKYIGESRVPDDVIDKLVTPEDIQPITGKAGTCVFVDTSRCFHYGSRVHTGEHERIITLYQYLTPTAFTLPLDFKSKAPFHHLNSLQLSPLQLMALGAN